MNFEAALSTHLKWKIKLRMAVEGHSGEALDPNVVCKDDLCELGKWIQEETGRATAAKPEFGQLKTAHTEFHQVAASVLRKAIAGDKVGATAQLDGDYNRLSSTVLQALTRFRVACR